MINYYDPNPKRPDSPSSFLFSRVKPTPCSSLSSHWGHETGPVREQAPAPPQIRTSLYRLPEAQGEDQ